MTPYAAIVGGGAAGFFGAAAAHVLTNLADRAGAEDMLRGPYGPQFFLIALYTGLFYAAIGAAAGRRASTSLAGLLGPLLGIAGTMAALTRYGGWGMPSGLPGTPQWQLAVLVVYTATIWCTIALIGAASAEAPRWRGALAAVLGSLAAVALLAAFQTLVPSYGKGKWNPAAMIPSPVNLLDGLLSGACLCLALSLDSKLRRKPA